MSEKIASIQNELVDCENKATELKHQLEMLQKSETNLEKSRSLIGDIPPEIVYTWFVDKQSKK